MFDDVMWSALLDEVEGSLRALQDAEVQLVAAALAAERCGAWMGAGARSAHRFLTGFSGFGPDRVRELVAAVRFLRGRPASLAAFEARVLSVAQAARLGWACTPARVPYFDGSAEELFIRHAEQLRSARDFGRKVDEWTAVVDQYIREPTIARAPTLYLQTRLDGGCDLVGCLDAHGTGTLLAGLDRFDSGPDPRNAPGGPRTSAERRADALVECMARGLALGDDDDPVDDPVGDPVPDDADLDVEPDWHETAAERADRLDRAARRRHHRAAQRRRRSQRPLRLPPTRTLDVVIDLRSLAGRAPGDPGEILSRTDGRTITARAVEAVLCGSMIAALVVDADGVVVHASERSAAFTPTQLRLLAARDGGCVFPGCDRPPSWCDGHHLHWRNHGGTNELDNGAMVCRRHHRLIHSSGWTLQRHDGRWQATSPLGRVYTGRPTHPLHN